MNEDEIIGTRKLYAVKCTDGFCGQKWKNKPFNSLNLSIRLNTDDAFVWFNFGSLHKF